ncbi:MAG TPA: hypothetical protein VK750_09090, partial [Cytophagaceae bacterium]|nr:hypothetical protein [Cytophagaceae bacterium]
MKTKIILSIALTLAMLKVSATTFVVNTTVTGGWNALNTGSLPWAIGQVNAAGAGPHTIQITATGVCDASADNPASYVLSNSSVTIDGGAACGTPAFFLKGPAYSFFSVTGNNVTIKGIGITQFSLNVTGSGFKIFGCWLGLTTAGTATTGSAPGPSYALSVTGGSATIGYNGVCGRNVFSMTGVTNSVVVTGNSNKVNGNYFGSGSNGTTRLVTGTQVSGSVIAIQGNNNTVDSNVVLGSCGGGNFGGIAVTGASVAININQNIIGLNASGLFSNGAAAYGNDGHGIYTAGAITGASFITGNTISNNKQSGISMEASVNGLTINKNIVGLPGSGVQGSTTYGNGDSGIRVYSTTATAVLIDNNTVCNSGLVNSSTNAATNSGIIF